MSDWSQDVDYGQELCDSVVEYLRSQTYSQQFSVTAPEDPSTELNLDGSGEKYKDIRVFVVPVNEIEVKGDRGGHVAVRQTVNIFISKFMEPTDPRQQLPTVQRKGMSTLYAQIRKSLRFVNMLEGCWVWEANETVVPYDPDKLRTQFRFLGVIGVTYWNTE